MRPFLGQLSRLFPLRVGGMLLLAIGLGLVFGWSPAQADFLLYPAGLVAVGLVIGCALVVTLGTVGLLRTLRALPASLPPELETTRATGTGFQVPALRGALILEVSSAWVEPAGVHSDLERSEGVLTEVVTPSQRGRFTRLVRRFSVEDVFGLARLSFDLSWEAQLSIIPVSATQSAQLAAGHAQGETLANPAGRIEGDLVEMRAYAHGDSMRHVLWKAYARTRKLLVRMPERALAPGPVSLAFFVAGADDEASAGVARLYLEAGLLGSDLLFSADGATAPARTPRDALDQIVNSSAHREHGGQSLEAIAAQMDPARLTSCLVFCPPVDGPWRARLVDFVRHYGLNTTVIIGVEGGQRQAGSTAWLASVLFEAEVGLESESPLLTKLRAGLAADGLAVNVIERSTGGVV